MPLYFILRWSTALSGRWGLRAKERIFALNRSFGVTVVGSLLMEGNPFLMRSEWGWVSDGRQRIKWTVVLVPWTVSSRHREYRQTSAWDTSVTWDVHSNQSSSLLFVYQGKNQPQFIFPIRHPSWMECEEIADERSSSSAFHFSHVTRGKL